MRALLATLILTAGLFSANSFAGGVKRAPLTAILLPANYTLMQLGFDIANRNPAVLFSYQTDPDSGRPFIHRWTGQGWTHVRNTDFKAGKLGSITPGRILIVGDQGQVTDQLITDAENWSNDVLNLASTQPDDFVNTSGKLFNFNKRDYKYFANKYNMNLGDLNQGRRSQSWYNQNSVQTRQNDKSIKYQRVYNETPAMAPQPVPVVVEPKSTVQSLQFVPHSTVIKRSEKISDQGVIVREEAKIEKPAFETIDVREVDIISIDRSPLK